MDDELAAARKDRVVFAAGGRLDLQPYRIGDRLPSFQRSSAGRSIASLPSALVVAVPVKIGVGGWGGCHQQSMQIHGLSLLPKL